MANYLTIKSLASRVGLSPKDLLALSPQNDPFYVGAPRQLQKGQWFAKVYAAMGSPERCHIRRVHYWLVTTQALPKPDGKPYQNTQNDWGILTLSAKYARYLGLVPIENIIDRRNPEPYIYSDYWSNITPSAVRDSIDTESIISDLVDRFNCFNPHHTQAYHLEIWCEKSTMNDVIEPICARYGMNLVTGLGELSITSVYLLAQRITQANKPIRIFYVSDFDPAGECMPVSVARKIEYFVRQYDVLTLTHNQDNNPNIDVKLIPVMLTAEQCKEYDLPRTPIKETELRKEGFEVRHGVGATELDAMEALHPGEMTRIIESAITPYFDIDKWNEVVRKNREIKEQVREYLEGGKECKRCAGSGEARQTDESEEWPIDCPDCSGSGEVSGRITSDIITDLDTSTLDDYTTPISLPINDTSSKWLYDSSLDYTSQIDRYRKHQQSISDPTDDNIDIEDL